MHLAQRYRLVSPTLLRTLMERTGAGSRVSGRELATRVGVSHGLITNLLNGITKTTRAEVAQGICRVIGVDLLILWAPTGRSVPADDIDNQPTTVVLA
ncbi:helix-turn-helix domain-containing protein [Streptomyces marianii]|uniref:Helix-turn-helix transcriptional regulator n=1 Tax=Streptomyces marianii TaxID=1817406 RepID=A0A5R9E0I0_9ACTN|nr:helix-turn-helix transcriptional regulator [Streptomyces marianii]TLQ43451.1 helix-turn-helix transcriptional regulator [Streptomyces marianii]